MTSLQVDGRLLANLDSNTPNRAFSKQDHSWMQAARVLAGMSTERQKHGAIIVSGGRVLATGVNVFRNDPRNVDPLNKAYTYHAECRAYQGLHAQHLQKKMTIYVARINNRYEPMMSEPCSECWSSLITRNFRIVWTTGGYHVSAAV